MELLHGSLYAFILQFHIFYFLCVPKMVIVQIPHHYDLEVTFLKLLLLLNRVGCSGYKSVRCEKDNFSKIIGAL